VIIERMSIPSILRTNLAALACLLAVGCATTPSRVKLYEGPDRSEAEVASLLVPYTITIKDINGVERPSEISLRSPTDQHLVLIPGAYLFGFKFSSPYEFGPDYPGVTTPRMERKAVLEAGHTYRFMSRVTGDASSSDVDVWIADNGTTARVDEVPPTPAPKPMDVEPTAAPAAPAPVAKSQPTTAVAEVSEKAPSSSVDDLKRSWQSATPDERAEFLKSIVSP
jgi:hypothetical protein